jgi:hypothetical protein
MKFNQLILEKSEEEIYHFKTKNNVRYSIINKDGYKLFYFSKAFDAWSGLGLNKKHNQKKIFEEAEKIWLYCKDVPNKYLMDLKNLERQHNLYWRSSQ